MLEEHGKHRGDFVIVLSARSVSGSVHHRAETARAVPAVGDAVHARHLDDRVVGQERLEMLRHADRADAGAAAAVRDAESPAQQKIELGTLVSSTCFRS